MLVLNNRDLNQVTWEQRALQGDPKYPATQEIPDFPYARFAELIGLQRHPRRRPRARRRGLGRGARRRPAVVLEAVVDPEVPPLPPHITLEQAKHFAQAVLAGDPHRGRVMRQSLRQMLDAILPGR